MGTAHLPTPSPYRDTKAAAEYLHISPSWLEALRVRGGGPAYLKLGPKRVVYRLEDLDAWATAQRRLSTSQEIQEG